MNDLKRTRLFALGVVLLIFAPVGYGAEIYFCQNNTCLCLTWTVGATGYIEIRCGSGSGSGWTSNLALPAMEAGDHGEAQEHQKLHHHRFPA